MDPNAIKFSIIECLNNPLPPEKSALNYLQSEIEKNPSWEIVSIYKGCLEANEIAEQIIFACDEEDVDIVITCGGSGLGEEEHAPEGAMLACDRIASGLTYALLSRSYAITEYSMMTRALCLQRGRHIVINFPGRRRAASENWSCISDMLDHAVKMASR